MQDVTLRIPDHERALIRELTTGLFELATELRRHNPEGHLPEKCRDRVCTYFSHYLAFGPAELTHDGYHAAEEKCKQHQLTISDWAERNPDDPIPVRMMSIADAWEKRIRA